LRKMRNFASDEIKGNEGAFSQEPDLIEMSFDIFELLKDSIALIVRELRFAVTSNFQICD